MPQEDAALQLSVIEERYAREKRELARSQPARPEGRRTSIRKRAGMAVIGLGEKLAGEPREPISPRTRTRRFATGPS